MARRPLVGLDIGSSGVRAAELTLGRHGVTLDRFGQVALPEGAMHEGEVRDVDAVAAALKQLWAQAKFGSKRVAVGVANQRVIVRQVDLPWLPVGEMRKSLAFQVQDFIPMPVEEAILDFHPLEEFTSDSGTRMMRVLLVAASRDMVNGMLEAVTKAGLQPAGVDLNSFALLRSMAHAAPAVHEASADALVDVGASVTNIVVHQGGVPRFVRILLMGGSTITDALVERLGVPTDQAEALKQSTGLAHEAAQAGSHPAQRTIEQASAAFIDEVRGSLDYYTSQSGAVRISRVVLSGGGSLLPGLVERLASATRLPVEQARPMAALTVGKTGLTPEQLAYIEPMAALPLGLALGADA